jgi:hypothetical protein
LTFSKNYLFAQQAQTSAASSASINKHQQASLKNKQQQAAASRIFSKSVLTLNATSVI